MNQLLPVGQYNRTAYFYAADTSTIIGRFSKDAAAAVMCRLDYTGLSNPPTGDGDVTFSIDIGSNPPLAVSSSSLDPSGNFADFILSGGVEGQTYELHISTSGTNGRMDIMFVDVPATPCECVPNPGPNVSTYPAGYGMVYINSAVKYTVTPYTPPGPNIKDQWYNPETGVLYEYITDGVTDWWQQITPTLETTVATYKLQPIVPDGVTLSFTLLTVSGRSPIILTSTDLIVSVDDVLQNPDVDFRAFQDQIQFTVAPAVDSIIFMTWFAHY